MFHHLKSDLLAALYFSALVFFLVFFTALPSARADEPPAPPAKAEGGEIHVSLDEAHHVWIVPNIAPIRSSFNFGGTSLNPGEENASGAQIGVQLLSSSNRTRSLLVGLDLRQLLEQADGFRGLNILGTKLGIRLEYRPFIWGRPGFGMAYFFGDTIAVHDRDRQFSGNTAAAFVGMNVGRTRLFLEYTFGSYAEGPGFILLARASGSDTMNYRSAALGIEFPIDVLWPEWLRVSPPPPSPVTPY